jgi:hypothetical protein
MSVRGAATAQKANKNGHNRNSESRAALASCRAAMAAMQA